MSEKHEPLVIVLSAPSGSGKTTIVNMLLDRLGGVERSVSYTTRAPREGEKKDRDYIFVPDAEFDKRLEEGDFLESEQNFDNRYGTSRQQVLNALEKGKDIILSIDVKGARTIKKVFPESISVFIMPPSEKELSERLAGRNTEDPEQLSMRLREAQKELEAAEGYDYMIINDDLEKAVDELKTIIEQERANRRNIKKEEI
ncbi:MAG: guanylate kinase [Candidatus Omnitrophica bacterium]|nr:guanylate kinase [Candidatus Omnitrophota bacterium]